MDQTPDDHVGAPEPAAQPTKRPRTRRATLASEGYGDGRVTPHRYVRTEWRPWRPEDPSKPQAVQAFVFECEETGAERVWGNAS